MALALVYGRSGSTNPGYILAFAGKSFQEGSKLTEVSREAIAQRVRPLSANQDILR